MQANGYSLKTTILSTVLFVFNVISVCYAQYPAPAYFGPDSHAAFPWTDNFYPAVSNLSIAAEAPSVSEWTRQADPGESLIIAGDNLSLFDTDAEEGSDTHFTIYAENAQSSGLIQRLKGWQCALTLPEGLLPGCMYLVWPENAAGYGIPFGVNQTEVWWVGPDKIARGGLFSVFGRNLSLKNKSCWLYIQELDRWIESVSQNPYKADFEFPAGVAVGTYTVYIHNGSGGRYGWSKPETLQVRPDITWTGPVLNVKDPATWPGYQGSSEGAVGDGVSDDFPAIREAYNIAKNIDYATVYFPAGHYMLSDTIFPNAERIRYKGDGMDATILQLLGPEQGYVGWANTVIMVRDETAIEDMELNKGDVHGNAVTAQGGGALIEDIYFNRARFSSLSRGPKKDNFAMQTVNLQQAGRYVFLNDCEFIGSGTMFLTGGYLRQLFLDNCEFIGIEDCNGLMGWSQREMSMINCKARPYDISDPTEGLGWAKGRWIHGGGTTIGDLYVGDCVSTNLGPRDAPYEVFGQIAQIENNPEPYSTQRMRVNEDFSGVEFAEGIFFEGATLRYIGEGHGEPGEGRGYRILKMDPSTGWIEFQRDWNTSPFVVGGDYAIRELVDQNSGEQFMWEYLPTYVATRPVSVQNARELTFNPSAIGENNVRSKTLVITEGPGIGQTRVIESYDPATGKVLLEEPLRILPKVNESLCKIGDGMYRMAFYGNDLNGRPSLIQPNVDTATCALNAYGSSANLVFVSNRVANIESGVMYFSYGADGGVNAGPEGMAATLFNYVEDNHFVSLKYGIGISPDPNEDFDDSNTMMGHVFRGNRFEDIRDHVVGYSTRGGKYRADMILFEDNHATTFTKAVNIDDNLYHQVWLGNTLIGNNHDAAIPASATHKPVLVENTLSGFTNPYGSAHTGPLLEVPQRVIRLNPSRTTLPVAVYNSGSAPLALSVTTADDWITLADLDTGISHESDIAEFTIGIDTGKVPAGRVEGIVQIVGSDQTRLMTVIYDPDAMTVEPSADRIRYELIGFEGEQVKIELYDESMDRTIPVGEFDSPNEVTLENLERGHVYLLRIYKYVSASNDWVLQKDKSYIHSD